MEKVDALFDLVREKKPIKWTVRVAKDLGLDAQGAQRLILFLKSRGYVFNIKANEYQYKEGK